MLENLKHFKHENKRRDGGTTSQWIKSHFQLLTWHSAILVQQQFNHQNIPKHSDTIFQHVIQKLYCSRALSINAQTITTTTTTTRKRRTTRHEQQKQQLVTTTTATTTKQTNKQKQTKTNKQTNNHTHLLWRHRYGPLRHFFAEAPITEKMREIKRRNSRKAQPSRPAAAIWDLDDGTWPPYCQLLKKRGCLNMDKVHLRS